MKKEIIRLSPLNFAEEQLLKMKEDFRKGVFGEKSQTNVHIARSLSVSIDTSKISEKNEYVEIVNDLENSINRLFARSQYSLDLTVAEAVVVMLKNQLQQETWEKSYKSSINEWLETAVETTLLAMQDWWDEICRLTEKELVNH